MATWFKGVGRGAVVANTGGMKKTRKLSLRRETVKSLSEHDLSRVGTSVDRDRHVDLDPLRALRLQVVTDRLRTPGAVVGHRPARLEVAAPVERRGALLQILRVDVPTATRRGDATGGGDTAAVVVGAAVGQAVASGEVRLHLRRRRTGHRRVAEGDRVDVRAERRRAVRRTTVPGREADRSQRADVVVPSGDDVNHTAAVVGTGRSRHAGGERARLRLRMAEEGRR
jgi:hypothetical protein